MVVNFDIFDRVRTPEITLCNPMGQQLYILSNLKNKKAILRYNAISEFTFEATNKINDIYNEYFDYLQSTRIINVEFVGSFIITKVIEVDYGVYKTKQVQCKSLEYEMVDKGIYLEQGTYKFYDPIKPENTIMNEIMSHIPDWRIGSVDSDLWNLYRTFEIVDKNLYDFTMNEVEEAFECIFIFDTINKTVSAKTTKNAVTPSDIYFSDRNVVKELSLEESSDQLKTALNVFGADDLGILTVNPLGTNTIYDFSYFKNTNWMTDGLINALTTWENKVKSTTNTHATDLTELKKLNGELIPLKTKLTEYKSDLAALETTKAVRMEQGLDLTDINNQITSKKNSITTQESLITSKEAQIKAIKDKISNSNKALSFDSNFTQEQYIELRKFIKTSTYQNDSFVVTDSMDDTKTQEVVQELYDMGCDVLKRLSTPKLTFNMQSMDFLKLIDYKDMSRELNLGSEITIDMKEKGFAHPVLLELEIDYDNYENLTLGFGNRLRLDKSEYTFSELFKDTVNTSSDVSFNKGKWGEGLKAKNWMNDFLNSSLNASVQDIVNSDNQDILIDGSGIRCRRMNPDTGQYDPEQLWITGKSMVLSDDTFQTAKTAIGRIKLPDGTYSYGINAEILMSKIVATSQLIIENEGGTFRVDADGVTLINAKLIIRNESGDTTVEDELNKVDQEIINAKNEASNNLGDAVTNLNNAINSVKNEMSTNLNDAIGKVTTDLETLADGVVEIFYEQSSPTTGMSHGDLWFDISPSGGNKLYRYNGKTTPKAWEEIQDKAIVDAFKKAEGAQSTADGKITSYYQNEPPTGTDDKPLGEGDLWVDTNDSNKLYRYNITSKRWVSAEYSGINDATMDILNQKTTTYYCSQAQLPATDKLIDGDLWFDTSTYPNTNTPKNKLYRWNNVKWIEITDAQIIDAINKANNAQDTADKKIVTYYQPTDPLLDANASVGSGDLWIDTDNNNAMYRYDGIKWIDISYKGINQAIANQIQGALDKITDVEAKADGKVDIFYSETDPSLISSNNVKYGDIWVDISRGTNGKPKNKMSRRTNTNSWESIEDSSISDIFGHLGDMESAIDGKVTTYYCNKTQLPADSKLNEGDLWVDTSNNNKLMIRHGVYWVDVSIMGEDQAQDWAEAIRKSTEALEKADQALALEDKMIHTFYQSNEPSGAKVGDLWLNTATGRVCIYTSLGWKESQDKSIIDAVNKAQQAMDKADSKITTYYQDTMPTEGELGDLWVHTGRNNEVFVHNGSTFVKTMGDLQDKVDDLITSVHDAYFDHGQKYWSEQYNGQIVESANIGTITSDGISGSKAWKIQGQHSIYTKNPIPVDKERTYKFTFKIKQLTHAKTEYPMSQWFERTLSNMGEETFWNLTWFLSQEMKIKVGVVCLDKSFKTIGSPKYFVSDERLLSINEGWITLTANISGYGSEINQFANGTLYMRPTFVVNYPNGDGEVLVDSFSVIDITEVKTAQDTADDALNKVENVLTVEGNLNTSKLEGTLNAHANQILAGANMQLQIDKDGIWAMNNGDKNTATKVVAMNENGIVMAKERINGSLNWRTAISPLGINADEINTGKLRALDILGCNFEVSNDKSKITLNPTDGIKIQKRSGSIWKDTLSIDANGDAIFRGGINVNDRFTVNTSGDVVANSIRITGGVINDSQLVGGSLNIGNGNFTVDTNGNVVMNGSIAWGSSNSPVKVQYSVDGNGGWHNGWQPNDKFAKYSYDGGMTWTGAMKIVGTDGVNGSNANVPGYIKETYIDSTQIISPTISGNVINSADFNGGSYSTYSNNFSTYGGKLDAYGLHMYTGNTQIGELRYTTSNDQGNPNALLLSSIGGYALKITSDDNISIQPNSNDKKVYIRNAAFMGAVYGCKVVFG